MKRFRFYPLILILFGGLFAGCEPLVEETGGTVQLTGQVLNAQTNNPVPDAIVRVMPYNLVTEVDDEGRFALAVEIGSTMELEVSATSTGFAEGSVNVAAVADREVVVPPLRLSQTAAGPAKSGRPSNILLLNQSGGSIGVKESGSEEVTQLHFQVADSLGRPVVLDHAAEVAFSFGQHPGGGEFISPATARTDNNGQVTVNLSAGTKAGVVQIVAETEVGGRRIRSLPVAVSIHGGLPVAERFTLAAQKYNFPGLTLAGLANGISVIVGDRWGNPVKPGTSVYFTTTGGVIEGSTLTNGMGQGSAQMISGNPIPVNGVAIVTATTADADQRSVTTQIPVLMTGPTEVEVSPGAAALDQSYVVRIADALDNPLGKDTKITIRADGENVKAVGDVDVTLGETTFNYDPNGDGDLSDAYPIRGRGRTEFRFSILSAGEKDGNDVPKPSKVVSFTITVASPNGDLNLTWPASGAAKTGSAEVITTRSGGTAYRAKL